ncbi:DUF2255 family protein [Homoserinibacter sp. YIM 151385]|uniref:DUF2255 family protein n=1 Tax=Homoserinibacter sp. YIM 151385 TaxID=2985506 RepID=UPI0022F0CCFF|nr:DUF2255 family protein [Homoserinibacter sp. YIM 151385]WBU37205.1 DUF2255 family protein [Homoserinibacter sp. YIM 151385]
MSDADRIIQHLDETDTITIATRRRSGELVPTFIWSAVADGAGDRVGYLRSAFGPGSWWYRRATADGWMGLDLGAEPEDTEGTPSAAWVELVELAVEHVPDDAVHAAEHEALDAALTAKYGHDPQNLAPMLSEDARACTLRVRIHEEARA